MRVLIGFVLLACCLACSNPRNTKLPQDLANIEAIKPAMDKLKPDEKELLTGYIMRHTIGSAFGAAFGQKSDPIPAGITIGQAIDEQRAFIEKERAREAEEKAKKERAIAARKAAADQLAQVLAVRLVGIRAERGAGFGLGTWVYLSFEAENKGPKTITGMKGEAVFKDRFGDQIGTTDIKIETTFPAGKTTKFTIRDLVGGFSPENAKLAKADAASTSMIFTPSMVLFSDGTKAETPDLD